MGIEMAYTDFIKLIKAIEQAKAEIKELLKKDDMKWLTGIDSKALRK